MRRRKWAVSEKARAEQDLISGTEKVGTPECTVQ